MTSGGGGEEMLRAGCVMGRGRNKQVVAGQAGRRRAGDSIQEERDSVSVDDDNEDAQQAAPSLLVPNTLKYLMGHILSQSQ